MNTDEKMFGGQLFTLVGEANKQRISGVRGKGKAAILFAMTS